MQRPPVSFPRFPGLAKHNDTAYLGWRNMLSRVSNGNTAMGTPTIDIYTKFACPFCVQAKRLLASKGVDFNEHDVTMGGARRDEMMQRAPNAMTVPQIFIGDVHVGGSDDLVALDEAGRLDALLAG